jgi:molecular chaperone GrpE
MTDTQPIDEIPENDLPAADKSPETETDETSDSEETALEPSLEEQLQAAISERDENHDRWLRGQAELDNFRKRTLKEMEQMRLFQAIPLIRDLLPQLDNLNRAISATAESSSFEDLAEGVKMVAKQFQETISKAGVVEIAAVGEPFDPNLHEAVQQFPSDEHPAMTIIQEVQKGYLLHDRVVRASQVIVSSGPATQTDEPATEEQSSNTED